MSSLTTDSGTKPSPDLVRSESFLHSLMRKRVPLMLLCTGLLGLLLLPWEANVRTAQGRTLSANGISLRADLSAQQKITANFDPTHVTPQALQIYAELTGRKQLPLAGLKERAAEFFEACRWQRRPRAWTGLISYHADGLYSASEVKERLDLLFARNGLRAAPEGKHYFRMIKLAAPDHKRQQPAL